MKKTAILLMIIMMLSKLLGFVRELTLSYFYGASNISDIYLISLAIPTAIFGFIASGISTGYIPMYSKIEEEHGVKESDKYTNNLINILMIICTFLVFFSLIFTEEIVRLFASGFEGETLKLAIKFTRISLFSMYFTGIVSIFTGFLQLKGNYAIPALIGFPMNFIIILSILISSKTNIFVIAVGSLLGIVSQLLFMWPFIRKSGYKHKGIINIKDKYIKKMAYIALPVIVGASVNQINTLVDKTLASSIAVGGISALNYAGKLSDSILGLIVSTVAAVIYPNMSKMAAKNDMDGLKGTMSESINFINILIIPASIGMMIFAEEFVRLLFGRGAFTEEALVMTTGVFFYYAMGNIGYGLRQILYRVFYSLQDTKTPMMNASISVFINIILNIILSRYMGLNGLALATSISAIFCLILLFISIRRKIGPFGMKDISISFIKILFASLVMGILAKLSYGILIKYVAINLSLLLSIIVGVVIYFIMIFFLKIEEVDSIIEGVKNKSTRT